MKKLVAILLPLLAGIHLSAQTNNAPVRLALVAETADAAPVVDVLTAELSGSTNIQLLERDEIEKVYHEQATAAGNGDDVKLGRILGADGLLLLNVVRTTAATNLMMRLIAVKPGVILSDGSFAWPLKDAAQWADSAVPFLDTYLPKLGISANDSIPLSIVNLRSATQSAEAAETERDLKLLAIQRLSEEPRLFVLERQKMQLLGEEKELKSDESAFWDGSYLLDGIVDQNGYSKDTVTINARLTPPRGGAPLVFEVSGSRTNLAEVINALATNVTRLLNIQPTIKEWSAADEAAQYFDEAKWALKWGAYSESEAAADSAWALGKRDLAGAIVRVNAYIMETRSEFVPLQDGILYVSSGQSTSIWDWEIANISKTNAGAAFDKRLGEIDYSMMPDRPNPRGIETAIHALELYNDFSRTSTNAQLVTGSDWYNLGIADLIAGSKILQNFNFAPRAQLGVEDQLADLRSIARSVASLICDYPSVHESYFGPNASLPVDEYIGTFSEKPNIFLCELNWGCYWQETPRDEISFYLNLMNGGAFAQMHDDFWFRPAGQPLLVAWNEADRQHLNTAWEQFLQEMDTSTNLLARVEGKAIQLRDAANQDEAAAAITNFFETLIACRCALITNDIDFGFDDLTQAIYGDRTGGSGSIESVQTPERDALLKICDSYSNRLHAEDDRGAKMLEEQKNDDVFEKQRQYLASLTPYDFFAFTKVFENQNYTKAQAAELLPLIENYKSNLLAQTPGMQQFKARGGAQFIDVFLEAHVNQALNPPPPSKPQPERAKPSGPPPIVRHTAPAPIISNPPEIVSNVLVVNRSFTIPPEKLVTLYNSEVIDPQSQVTITAHHWFGDKLLLDLDCDIFIDTLNNGHIWNIRKQSGPAIAILDPSTGQWTLIACPEVDIMSKNNFYDRTVLLNHELFASDGNQIRKYDFNTEQWRTLKVSDGDHYELFVINGRLYAANGRIIFEITDDGQGTRILASTRRRPVVTALDKLDNLGTPVLFEGPADSIRAVVGNVIYTWDQNDWREEARLPHTTFRTESFNDGLLFHSSTRSGGDYWGELFRLAKGASSPDLCLSEYSHYENGHTYWRVQNTSSSPPLWQMPEGLVFGSLPGALDQSNLLLLAEHFGGQANSAGQNYDARLLYFSPDLPDPLQLFLRFDADDARSPLVGLDPGQLQSFPFADRTWILPEGNSIFFGRESPRNYMPGQNGATKGNDRAGVWLLPFSQLKPAMATARQSFTAKFAQANAAREKARNDLLAKYDLNHNGIIDPDEREAALADPAFIESELDKIDADHDGWLEANELSYFDANHNKILDPNEQTGIDLAQHVLASRLMKKFDMAGSGFLTSTEFEELEQSCTGDSRRMPNAFLLQRPDLISNGKIHLKDVEDFLKSLTVKSLRLPGSSRAVVNELEASNAIADRSLQFKLEVEYYWKNAPARSN